MRIDHTYILSLPDRVFSRKRCAFQLRRHGLTDFSFFDAIDGRSPAYDKLYSGIASRMDDGFRRHNFSRGALGCLLSHLEILRDAVAKKHKIILVLEDDFLLCSDFGERLGAVLGALPGRWDAVYLGKKQGRMDEPFHRHARVHHDPSFADPVGIDALFYRPSHRTWGSHALLLRHTVFDAVIKTGSEHFAPIDLVFISLYDRYAFIAVRKDLVITDESESTVLQKPQRTWDGWAGEYMCRKTWHIRRVFIVGDDFRRTHTYIHQMYKRYLEYYHPCLETTLSNDNEYLRHPGSIVICSPAHFRQKIVFQDTHLYIIHLDDDGRDTDFLEKYKKSHRLDAVVPKNYIITVCREQITDLSYFGSDAPRRVVCLPWFCSTLYHECAVPDRACVRSRRDGWLLFFGSVWPVNFHEILGLVRIVKKNGWRLVIKGRIFGVSDEQRRLFMNGMDESVRFEDFVYDTDHEHVNSLGSVLERYPVSAIIPLQGSFHHAGYMSNRIFECLSHGFLILTNNPFVKKRFVSAVFEPEPESLIACHEKLLSDETRWLRVFDAQKREYFEKFYGCLHLDRLFSFLQETAPDKLIVLDPGKEMSCRITFAGSREEPVANDTIRGLLTDPRDVVLCEDDLPAIDPFLLRRLAASPQYGNRVYISQCFKKKKHVHDLFLGSGIVFL